MEEIDPCEGDFKACVLLLAPSCLCLAATRKASFASEQWDQLPLGCLAQRQRAKQWDQLTMGQKKPLLPLSGLLRYIVIATGRWQMVCSDVSWSQHKGAWPDHLVFLYTEVRVRGSARKETKIKKRLRLKKHKLFKQIEFYKEIMKITFFFKISFIY